MQTIRGTVSGETSTRQRGRAFLAVPLILVNLTAVWGQAGWAFDHITGGGLTGLLIALVFALAVESIGVYLAWESHESLMADQASALLRFGSYGVGLLVGLLNFLHFSGQSLAAGVAFGALSAVSPWLWGIWSRARNRARLAELGLVDIRGVKLSLARKVWHPIRSVRVLSWAAWAGVTDPADAVAQWQESRQKSMSHSETPQVTETLDDEPEFVEPAALPQRALAVDAPTPAVDTPVVEESAPEPVETLNRIDSTPTPPRRLTAVSPAETPWGPRARELKRKGVKHATAYRQAKKEWRQKNEVSA